MFQAQNSNIPHNFTDDAKYITYKVLKVNTSFDKMSTRTPLIRGFPRQILLLTPTKDLSTIQQMLLKPTKPSVGTQY